MQLGLESRCALRDEQRLEAKPQKELANNRVGEVDA